MYLITAVLIALSLVVSGSSKDSEEEYNTVDNSELESFLYEHGFATFDGTDPQNAEGKHPLQLAVELEYFEVARMLIDQGVNTDIMYTLENDHAGLFQCDMPAEEIEEVSELYGSVEMVEVDLMTEGTSTPVLELTFENDTSKSLVLEMIETDNAIWRVWRIGIFSDRFVTEEGIGIGSTFEELEINYVIEGVFWSENGDPCAVVEALRMSFILEQGDWWQMGEVVGEIPGDTKITHILVVGNDF